MARESVEAYVKRVDKEAERGIAANIEGHVGEVKFDWAKTFRSRPASDDWQTSCSCGWVASRYSHSETEGWAKFWRHVKSYVQITG